MSSDLKKRVKKTGQVPGTLTYTGSRTKLAPEVAILTYSKDQVKELISSTFDANFKQSEANMVTWIHVSGLYNINLVDTITSHYNLHPLTVEDILNVSQRSKIEDFKNYIFVTMKIILWNESLDEDDIEQLSIVIGENFVLSFSESKLPIFNSIRERLRSENNQSFLENGSDYLAYRLMDCAIDQYFLAIEKLNDRIESIEERIVLNPITKNAHELYHLKHKLLLLHKSVWPIREEISQLLQVDHKFITSSTRLYLRDVYDHVVQAIDIIENLRDILSSILEIYLSLTTNKLNEIMKVLTVIATFFMPITFITSLYGMNFKYMPELSWHYGYPLVLCVMLIVSCGMLIYFRRKKWI